MSGKTALAILALSLLAFVFGTYYLCVWGFESPHSVANAVKADKIRGGMGKQEVVAVLGDHGQKDRLGKGPADEQWCRWFECIYFRQGRLVRVRTD